MNLQTSPGVGPQTGQPRALVPNPFGVCRSEIGVRPPFAVTGMVSSKTFAKSILDT